MISGDRPRTEKVVATSHLPSDVTDDITFGEQWTCLCLLAHRSVARFQLLGEHHEDAAGAADIGELVDVLVDRHAARPRQPCRAAISRASSMSSTEKATRCMPISLGRVGFVSIASGVDILERLGAAAAVGVEHGDVCVVPVEADGGVGPLLTVSRPRTVRPRSVEKAIIASEVADGVQNVARGLMGCVHATERVPRRKCVETHSRRRSPTRANRPPAGTRYRVPGADLEPAQARSAGRGPSSGRWCQRSLVGSAAPQVARWPRRDQVPMMAPTRPPQSKMSVSPIPSPRVKMT